MRSVLLCRGNGEANLDEAKSKEHGRDQEDGVDGKNGDLFE